MTQNTLRIDYETGTDGWGAEPTEDDCATFVALVELRLAERFPESRVSTNGDLDIDPDEIRSWIGNEVWGEWCSGVRAPEDAP